MATSPDQIDLLKRRAKAVQRARTNLLEYVRLLHPTPDNPDDPDASLYEVNKHHKMIADELQHLARPIRGRRKVRRLIIVMPPRHGKSELATKSFVPWFMGQNPDKSMLVATYSDTFAIDLGRAIRTNIEHPATKQVFPGLELDPDARSAARMQTTKRGMVGVVGRGSAITGRGGDILLVDDPIKDRKEADSQAIRNQLWDWFNQVFMTRLMTDTGSVVLIQTRWHEDDLVGRLTDENNSHYNPNEAAKWKVIHLPAIAKKEDPLGRAEGRSLWPKRFNVQYLRGIQGQDPRGFSALYQGEPSPEDGTFFQEHSLSTYKASDMPDPMIIRWYMATDFAVSTAQDADKTCMGMAGMDPYGIIWVHPQLTWTRMTTDQAVEAALWLIKKYRPTFWFAERGVIQKSIGPFLRRRMMEEQAFTSIREFTPIKDKMARAQSIAGRMQQGTVRYPAFAAWWPDAKRELLSFPYGSNDDFVDFMSLFGLGLDALTPGERKYSLEGNFTKNAPKPAAKFGTLGWVKEQAAHDRARRSSAKGQGW